LAHPVEMMHIATLKPRSDDVMTDNVCRLTAVCATVFFNLFVAAEPYTSVKITHGTPCTDP